MFTVWYRNNDEEQWIQDTNGKGERVQHSLDSAIKCMRFHQRMFGREVKRVPVEAE